MVQSGDQLTSYALAEPMYSGQPRDVLFGISHNRVTDLLQPI